MVKKHLISSYCQVSIDTNDVFDSLHDIKHPEQ